MTWLLTLAGKAKFYALAAVAAVAAVFVAYWRVRQDGVNAAQIEQQQARDHLQEHYDEIDRHPATPDDAYAHLRGLSDDKGHR